MDNKEKNFVSAVIYVYNNEDIVCEALNRISGVLKNHVGKAEIICVNDFSEDDSASKIKEYCDESQGISITLLNMSHFHGVEMAMNAGVDLAIGDYVFEFDSCFIDYTDEDVLDVYYTALKGFDIVSASSDKKQRFTSKLFYKIFAKFSNVDMDMNTERFRVLTRRAINRIDSMNKTIPYRKAIYANCGLKSTNIIYKEQKIMDDTCANLGYYRLNLATDSLILFTDIGYRITAFLTILMTLVMVGIAVYALVVKLTSNPVRGWTTTVLFMTFAFAGLFAILTIIIKYLNILVDLTFKKKKYNYESVEKLTK